jgi:hypothetical protein
MTFLPQLCPCSSPSFLPLLTLLITLLPLRSIINHGHDDQSSSTPCPMATTFGMALAATMTLRQVDPTMMAKDQIQRRMARITTTMYVYQKWCKGDATTSKKKRLSRKKPIWQKRWVDTKGSDSKDIAEEEEGGDEGQGEDGSNHDNYVNQGGTMTPTWGGPHNSKSPSPLGLPMPRCARISRQQARDPIQNNRPTAAVAAEAQDGGQGAAQMLRLWCIMILLGTNWHWNSR